MSRRRYGSRLSSSSACFASLVPARQTWLLTAVYTGARLSELCALTWADVDFAAGLVHARHQDRAQRSTPPGASAAGSAPKGRAESARPRAGPWGSVRRDLAVACRKLGVPVVTPNDLRRTFASWLVQGASRAMWSPSCSVTAAAPWWSASMAAWPRTPCWPPWASFPARAPRAGFSR